METLDTLAGADKLGRRPHRPERMDVEGLVEDRAVFQVSPQGEVARRQMAAICSYHAPTGRVKVSANAAVERKKLVELFAEHMIGDADFFKGSDSQRLYTLEPIRTANTTFRFKHEWDPEVLSVAVKELQVDEGEHEVDGKTRYSPWAMTVRDSPNAVDRLLDLATDDDLPDLRINYAKLEFRFDVGGQESRVLVKIKPPSVASFRDHSFEAKIMEHLERNGIRLTRAADATAAAAE